MVKDFPVHSVTPITVVLHQTHRGYSSVWVEHFETLECYSVIATWVVIFKTIFQVLSVSIFLDVLILPVIAALALPS